MLDEKFLIIIAILMCISIPVVTSIVAYNHADTNNHVNDQYNDTMVVKYQDNQSFNKLDNQKRDKLKHHHLRSSTVSAGYVSCGVANGII